MKNLLLRICCLFAVSILTCHVGALEKDRVFFVFNASDGLADNSAQTIKCTYTGRMVVTTIGHVNFYDGSSFTHIDPKPENDYPLPKYNGHYHLYFDKHHHLWVKDKRKTTCVDLMTERFVLDVAGELSKMGIHQQVDDLFGDDDNKLWFLIGNQLVSTDYGKKIPVNSQVELHDVDVYHGVVYLFYANTMVSAYDLKTGKHLYDETALEGEDQANYSRSSVLLPDSGSFYQIRNGDKEAVLLKFDTRSRKWSVVIWSPFHLNNMVIHNGKLYIACEYGIQRYDPQTGELHHYRELILERSRRLLTDVNTLAFDRQGGLWLGTERQGLLYSRPFPSPFTTYTWDQPEAGRYALLLEKQPAVASPPQLPRHVNCRFTDSRGWVWTGLYTGLQLEKTNAKGKQAKYLFTRQDGLLNEMIYSVVEDDYHDIWAGTSYGISHLYIRHDSVWRIETYHDQDNVPNESFVRARAMKLKNGTIVMQSLDHIITFDPSCFYGDTIEHIRLFPKLIKMAVNGTDVQVGTMVGDRVILDKAITRIREFTVDYNQNSISMMFSGMNYLRPVQTYYRFRVRGKFDKWRVVTYGKSDGMVDNKGILHLPLLGLLPGKYVVEVQASLSPDYWPMRPFEWTIYVEEPWWRATIVYILLGGLITSLFGLTLLMMNRNTKLRVWQAGAEHELLHRMKVLAERCVNMSKEIVKPYGTNSEERNNNEDYSKEYIDMMSKSVHYIILHPDDDITIPKLSELTGLTAPELYKLLSENKAVNPRALMLSLHLEQAARLLRETEMSVEEIAEECRFVSPNFFVASFFHRYRQTPDDYRNSMAL